jgi:hypothetical protein
VAQRGAVLSCDRRRRVAEQCRDFAQAAAGHDRQRPAASVAQRTQIVEQAGFDFHCIRRGRDIQQGPIEIEQESIPVISKGFWFYFQKVFHRSIADPRE